MVKWFKSFPRINCARKGRGRRWAVAHLGRERIMAQFRPERIKQFNQELVYNKNTGNLRFRSFPSRSQKSLRWHYPNQVYGSKVIPSSQPVIQAPRVFDCKIKTGDNPCGMPPVKNPCVMTSYGGIIRIRLKGRSSVTSSQPASQAPLYLFLVLRYTQLSKNARGKSKRTGVFLR